MKQLKRNNVKVPVAMNYRSGWSVSQKLVHFLENKNLNNKRSEIYRELEAVIY